MTRLRRILSGLALFAGVTSAHAAQLGRSPVARGAGPERRYSIQDLGPVLEGADGAPSIDARGQVALCTADGAVLWESGKRRLLAGLAGACALGVRGEVVGWVEGPSRRAALWKAGTIELVGPEVGTESVALSINPGGRIVGTHRLEGSTVEHSFLHDRGSTTDLGGLGGARMRACDVNARQTIVGCATTATGEERAFSWDRGRLSALVGLGSESAAEALNDAGVIVGRSRPPSGSGWIAFQWKEGKVSFPEALPGASETLPRDINDRGQIVGSSREGATERAVLIERGRAVDLNQCLEGAPGWELQCATGINASGAIVGVGLHAGQRVAFLLRPLVQRPNVLILLGDDFNWDDLRSVATPHIDALAARGMTFDNGYVFPLCSVTRYSLVFGRYPRRDGIGELVGVLPPSPENPVPPLGLPSIASVWTSSTSSPYETALIGKWHLGTNSFYDGNPDPDVGPADWGALTPLLHGFDHFLAGTMSNLERGVVDGGYFRWKRVDDGVYSVSTQYSAEAQLSAFRTFWDGGRSARIAYVAPNLAHAPHERPPDDWLPPGYPATTGTRDTFEAMLVAFDEFVGRVLAEVDLDDTYVFLLSDNGTQSNISITPCGRASSGGCTKGTTFQGGINMPFFVAGPRIPAGTTSSALVSSTDLMATVAEILDVPSPGDDSVSFWPTLLDATVHVRRYVFSETFGFSEDRFGEPFYHEDRSAIGERYKLRFSDGREDLFDLLQDPREGAPRNKNDPALQPVLAELRAVLANPLDKQLQL